MHLGVEHDLQAEGLALDGRQGRSQRAHHARPIEDRDALGVEAAASDHVPRLQVERITWTAEPDVETEGEQVGEAIGATTPDDVEVVERPPVEQVDIVATDHPGARPE